MSEQLDFHLSFKFSDKLRSVKNEVQRDGVMAGDKDPF